MVADVRTRTGVPGIAVAVVSGGAVAFAKGYGVREVGKRAAVDADTVFQLASVSKSIGATVVATRSATAPSSWDSRMADVLPWFALPTRAHGDADGRRPVFAHRCGLRDHAGDDLEDFGYGRARCSSGCASRRCDAFRDEYAYTNFGLTAAAAVAVAAGTDWETLSETASTGRSA